MKLTRTNLMILGLLAAVALFGQGLQTRMKTAQTPTFEDIVDLPGWRRAVFDGLSQAGGSATGSVLVGIGAEDAERLAPEALCRHLFPTTGNGLRAAFFTDINCPNCQSVELKLNDRSDRLDVNRLELPILGRGSEAYARAITAARLMNDPAIAEIVQEYHRGTSVGGILLVQLESAGVNPEQFQALAEGDEVSRVLRLNRAAADTLGVFGTPGLVIGRTLVMGDVEAGTLDELIDLEMTRTGAGC